MALAVCNSVTDHTGRELVEHGTTAFPIACYQDDLHKAPVPWHWHEELELAVITEGRCLVAAGSERRTLEAGEGFFVNASVLHGAWASDEGPARCHSIVFHPRLVGGSLDSVFYSRYLLPLLEGQNARVLFLKPGSPWQQAVLDQLETVWQACVREEPGYEFAVRQGLSGLVYGLHSHLAPQETLPDARSLREAQRIKTMLSFIHSHFGRELSSREIAASASLSVSACLRCFRATIGTTPIQYLRQYRLQQAAHRLVQGRESIGDIAFSCGFQDMSYFTRAFRTEMGCTPSEYRQKN